VVRHELGGEHDDHVVRMLLSGILEEADEWLDERSERRLDDDQRDARKLPFEPRTDSLACLEVIGDMDRGHVVRHGPGEPDRLDHVPRHVGRRDHHPLVAARWADDGLVADLVLDPTALVLTPDQQHAPDKDRDDDHDEPRAERELRDARRSRRAGGHGANPVDGDAPTPAITSVSSPVDDHPGLRA
jgi:hypothetical protein